MAVNNFMLGNLRMNGNFRHNTKNANFGFLIKGFIRQHVTNIEYSAGPSKRTPKRTKLRGQTF